MGIKEHFIGPIGYHKTDFNHISYWARKKIRNYQIQKRIGWYYFTGKLYSYAVYFHNNNDFTIYRK